MTRKKHIAILGSTGSIGTQSLDVISRHADCFEAHTLTAGSNATLLIEQARRFRPDTVVIADESKWNEVREALSDLPIKVYSGTDALCEVVQNSDIDMVLTAMVGFAGLRPTIAAIKARKPIALANKETLVVAGELIMQLCVSRGAPILPVDSEHSAIFQSLAGEGDNIIEKILLTASGGPFRQTSAENLAHVTPADALRHPNWTMGPKITIDSATLMNKGFEMIEARWLFGVAPERIEVLIHPESAIHSAVQFADGSIKAQLGVPDMRLPIQYAFSYPERLPLDGSRLDLFAMNALTFERPDVERFPCLPLAYEAAARGGNIPCAMNAANEVVNLAFRESRISFAHIPEIIAETIARIPFEASATLDSYFSTDAEARRLAGEML